MLIDWIILVLGALAVVGLVYVLNPGRNRLLWLVGLTLLFFMFPRAGIVVEQLQLPLPVAHVVAVLAVLYWLIFHQRQHRQRHTKYGKYFLIYIAIACMGLVIGLSSGGGFKLAMLETFFYIFSIGLFFYVNETFDQRHHFRHFSSAILLVSFCVSVYGIAQRYLGDTILLEGITYNSHTDLARSYVELPTPAERRVLSSYGDPNVLAGQLIVFTSIAFALLTGAGLAVRTRLMGAGLLALNVFCVYATGSRSGWVCIFFSVLILLAFRNRWLLLLLPLGLLALVMTGHGFTDALMAGVNPQLAKVAGDARFRYPGEMLQLFQIIPFGCGFGRTVGIYPDGVGWAFKISSVNTVWAGFNSYWMNILCRLGILGLLSFIALLAVLFRYIFNNIKTVDHPRVRAVLLGGTVGLMGQFIIWLANNTYFLPGGGLNYWFMMGMLVAGSRAWARPAENLLPYPGYMYGWAPRRLATA